MTDNPHYVTPEEVEDRLCPIKNKDWNGRYCCVGPKCMAWRWAEHFSIVMSNGIVTHKNSVGYSTTHGYCGIMRS